jgi:esterase/lipase superfamily enzyme
MQKQTWTWHSPHLPVPARVVRWGHFGAPLLLFPTAGGDFEEVERFELVNAVREFVEAGRVKVYSIDSVAGNTWLSHAAAPDYCSHVQNLFDAYIYEEVVPHIRRDCASDAIELLTAGASIGAFNALASLCRHPDCFRLAIGMSGTYDLSKYLQGHFNQDFYFSSPLHYLPSLGDSPQLTRLRERFVLLASGEGDYEDPGESWRLAAILGSKGIPNRVDLWGGGHHHDWRTWRAMLPRYLAEFVAP